MQALQELVAHTRAEMGKGIVGQKQLIDELIVVLLCGGHALIEGVPGIAKTLTVKLLGAILQIDTQRVQCTSDLMPADVIGSNVFNAAAASFTLHKGPLFTDLLLADEINRMPPRTQAALLEAMEERQITIDGTRYPLSEFFTVLATQNPVEFEGTYPLPEAQLDRFLLKINVTYPELDEEIAILEKHHQGFDARHIDEIHVNPLSSDLLRAARVEVKAVKVESALFKYLLEVIRKSRTWPSLLLGASPRAAVSLMQVAKAIAAMDGRDYLIPDDVKDAAGPVLRHRLLLKPEAELESIDTDAVIKDLLASVEVPR
jgi:MoxR-like ATPase